MGLVNMHFERDSGYGGMTVPSRAVFTFRPVDSSTMSDDSPKVNSLVLELNE